MLPDTNAQLISAESPQEYFQEALLEAVSRHQLPTCHETTLYLSNLLTAFVQTERLFAQSEQGSTLKPLAEIYAQALDAPSINERDRSLRHLGDVALFISGLFPQSLGRSLVDIDYYISMGGGAYGFLADSGRMCRSSSVFKTIFHELSDRFSAFVDILAEVGDNTNLRNDSDVLRLYEIWLCSGSKNAADKLHKLGIQPVSVDRLTH